MRRAQDMLSKTAGFVLFMLFTVMLLPILTYAAGLQNLNYTDNTVTGTVYGTTSEGFNHNPVTVDVYAPDGSLITTTQATYSSVTGSTYYYDFSDTLTSAYNYLRIQPDVTGSVYQDVYRTTTPTGGGGGGGCYCGGGGGYVPPGTNGNTIQLSSGDDQVDASQLSNLLGEYKNVIIKTSGDTVELPASALNGAKAGEKVTVENNLGSYEIPVSVLSLTDWAKTLKTDIKDLLIVVKIASPTADQQSAVHQAAAGEHTSVIANSMVDFEMQAKSSSAGNSIDIHSFGDTYVKRTINLSSQVDASMTTVALYRPDSGKLTFVPSTFAGNSDGQSGTVASFWRTGNSLYTVVKTHKLFSDVPDSYWAAKYINPLADKLIVAGETENLFKPKQSITRAEFAALLVRSLGVSGDAATNKFSDVPKNAWYENEVAVAAQDGIVYGYGDGTFRPNQTITREEVAAMVVRALKYAGHPVSLTSDELLKLYKPYQDVAYVSSWAHDELAEALKTGIVVGETDRILAPQNQATRAEATAMIQRYLAKAGFIQ